MRGEEGPLTVGAPAARQCSTAPLALLGASAVTRVQREGRMCDNLTRLEGMRGVLVRAAMVAALCLAGSAAAAQSPSAQPHCTPVGGSVMTNFITAATTLGTATGDLRG